MLYCTILLLVTLIRFADSQEFKTMDRDLFQDNDGPLKQHPISQNRLEPHWLQVKGHTVLLMLPNNSQHCTMMLCTGHKNSNLQTGRYISLLTAL